MTWRASIRNILRMSFRALLQPGALNIREILKKQGNYQVLAAHLPEKRGKLR
jgi:hypothetical protein